MYPSTPYILASVHPSLFYNASLPLLFLGTLKQLEDSLGHSRVSKAAGLASLDKSW